MDTVSIPLGGQPSVVAPRNILRAAFASYGSLLVGLCSGFLLTPILLHHLGVHLFGVLAIVGGLTGYLGLLEAGIGNATVRAVTRALSTNDDMLLRRCLGSAQLLNLASLLLSVLLSCGAFAVLPLLGVSGTDLHAASFAAVLLALAGGFQYLTQARVTLMLASGRVSVLVNLGTVLGVAGALVTLAVALVHPTLLSLSASSVIMALASALMIRRRVKRDFPAFPARLRDGDQATAMALLRDGRDQVVIAVASTVSTGLDTTILAALLNPAAVAAYAVAGRATGVIRSVTLRAADTLMPFYAAADATGDDRRQYRLFCMSTMLSVVLAVPGAIAMTVLAPELLHLWLGRVPDGSVAALIVLMFVLAFGVSGHNAFVLLTGRGQLGGIVRVTFVAPLINLPLSVIFTQFFGITGPALGSLVVVATVDALYFPVLVCRLVGERYRDYLCAVWLPLWPMAAVLSIGVPIATVLTGGPARVVGVGGVLAAGLAAVVAWGLDPTTRGVLTRSVRDMARRPQSNVSAAEIAGTVAPAPVR